MKKSIINKLDSTAERLEEISALLSDPEIISNQERFRNLSQEFSQIEPTVKLFHKYKNLMDDKEAAKDMLNDKDSSIRKMGEDELINIQKKEEEIQIQYRCSIWIPRF